ncbi:MAG: 50S ribosomal protein L25/general stress protein Ctc [Rhodospirillaceae bacterium]|nr:50S ribosomal protein L25/general stress protein Ctc [Rhodospirillaceae bacterium]
MTEVMNLNAEVRDGAGKGVARSLRRAGRIPAVIYGEKQDAISISLDYRELGKEYFRGGFFSRLCDLKIGSETVRVLPRDVQVNPVTDFPEHADFQRVGPNSQVRVAVPVHFVNEAASPGLKRGGVLAVVRHEIEIVCRAGGIPEALTVDLTGLMIGDSVHISSIALPDGVRPAISDRDFTVATITGVAVESEEGEEGAATDEEAAGAEDEEEAEESESEE